MHLFTYLLRNFVIAHAALELLVITSLDVSPLIGSGELLARSLTITNFRTRTLPEFCFSSVIGQALGRTGASRMERDVGRGTRGDERVERFG